MDTWNFKQGILLYWKAMVMLSWTVSFPFYRLFHWLICLQISIIFNSFSCNGVALVHEDCIAKMRLMSLVDLGSNESGQIPYALIKDTLQVYFLPFFFWIYGMVYLLLMFYKFLSRSIMMRWKNGLLRQELPS